MTVWVRARARGDTTDHAADWIAFVADANAARNSYQVAAAYLRQAPCEALVFIDDFTQRRWTPGGNSCPACEKALTP